MKEAGKSRIRIFSADGGQAGSYHHEHADGGLKSVPCDLSGYAPGVYFCIVDHRGRQRQAYQDQAREIHRYQDNTAWRL